MGFRNFIVHRHDRIDVEILVDVVNNRLGDFGQFRDEVLAYVQFVSLTSREYEDEMAQWRMALQFRSQGSVNSNQEADE